MSLLETLVSRLGRPAGKALDPAIRDIVHAVLKEHGYASPAEVQALRDEVRDMRARVDGMASRLDAVVKQADAARADAAAARDTAKAPVAVDTAPLTARIAELEAVVAGLRAAPAEAASSPAPLTAASRGQCKVDGCGVDVRSKGFCSPHYQQWRRGTLPGFVGLDGHVSAGGRELRVPVALAGGAAELRDGKLFVDGNAV